MTLAVKTKFTKADYVKKILIKKKLYDKRYNIQKEKGFVYFPIKKKIKIYGTEIVRIKFSKISNKTNLKKTLLKKLTGKEISKLISSYDIIGSIAIIEIPIILEKKEKLIAKEILKFNKNIKTVLKKSGIHLGEFRTQKLLWIAGKKTKETLYKENNVLMKINLHLYILKEFFYFFNKEIIY